MKKSLAYAILCGIIFCGKLTSAECMNWSGFYLGAQLGAGWTSTHWRYVNINPYVEAGTDGLISASDTHFHTAHFVGGAQFGLNYHYCRFLAGAEVGFALGQSSHNKDNIAQPFPGSEQKIKTEISSLVFATGRGGYLLNPCLLLYAKVGYAGSRIKTHGKTDPTPSGLHLNWNDPKWHPGWVVGGGVEYRFCRCPCLSFGAEYLHVSLNRTNHKGCLKGSNMTPQNEVDHDIHATIELILFRLNFLI